MNMLLSYSIHEIIKRFDPDEKGFITPTKFNKLIFLLYKNLLNKKVNIKLPYRWYFYGPESPQELLPSNYEIRNDFFEDRNYIVLSEETFTYNIDKETSSKIDLEISNIYYYRFEDIDKLVDDVYKLAPLDFQRNFRELNKKIKMHKNNQQSLAKFMGEGEEKRTSYDIYDKVSKSFPKEEFKEIYPLFLEWDDLIRYAIEEGKLIKMEKLIGDFWLTFGRGLGIKYNENIPSEKIEEWKEEYENSILKFDNILFEFKSKFYSEIYKPTNTEEKYVKELMEVAKSKIKEV